MKNQLTRFLGGFGSIIIAIIFLYLEFGGIYHSFAHIGIGHGCVSIFVPPYAWFRSVTLPFWLVERANVKKYFLELKKAGAGGDLFPRHEELQDMLGNMSEGKGFEEFGLELIETQEKWLDLSKQIDAPEQVKEFHSFYLEVTQQLLNRTKSQDWNDWNDLEIMVLDWTSVVEKVGERMYPLAKKYQLIDFLFETEP